ncbi:MAG: hypothetical protein ACR2G0_03770 [Chthoniobacterales bacterium]
MTVQPGNPFRTATHLLGSMVILLLVASCTAIPTSLGPLTVPLEYHPVAGPGEFPTIPSCAAFSSIQVVDGRLDATIGKRYVETNPSITAPVTTSSDVAAWMKAGASNAAQRLGISQQAGAATLRITVRQIAVSENVARRSGFEGRILISAELIRKGGGICWQDRLEGSSENYGYSGTPENYQETVNHALDRTMIRLLSDPGFQKNICACGG